MPFSGSGSFSPYTPGNPTIVGTTISSTAFNNTINDLAAGLSNAMTRDGQSPATNNVPMGGFKLTGVAAATMSGDALAYGTAPSLGVVYTPAGTGAVATTVQAKLREKVAVTDYSGADLGAQILAAIAALPATGGIVDCSMLQGAQSIPSKVAITKANVTILFGSATFTLSGVAATQSPFGAQFLITVANVWLIGNGATVFFMGAGAQANAVTFLHGAYLGGCVGIEMNGNKANNSGITDDTFQSAIQIINAVAGGATIDSQITVRDCILHDFIHYGIVTYGDLSNRNSFQNNLVYGNGKTADALSTGDGIYINKGSGHNRIEGNRCYSNKKSGIRLTSVATAQNNNKVVGNWSYSNGICGITADEQLNTSSVANIGQTGLLIAENHCYSNTGTGILLGTYDNVGVIANAIVQSNFVYSNSAYGILLQSNNNATSNTRQVVITDNQVYLNTLDGITVASNVLDCTVTNNNVISNTGSQIVNSGTRTLVFGNKDSITAPVFYESGTWTPVDGSGAGLSLTVAAATYVKIGKMVYATFAVTYPATANGTAARIGGLPYTSQNSAVSMHPVSIAFSNAGAALGGLVDSNLKTIAFVAPSGGASITNVNLSGVIVRGTAIYEIA